MFVGRHEARKGLAVLLDAFASVGSDVRLWIAGDGPETARLQAATVDDRRITWLGTIPEEEKRRRMRAADVVAAPSLHGESFGVVLLEAMASGTPVVASDLPGYRSVARGGIDAELVVPGDVAALAAALDSALTGGPQWQARVACARERAEAFSLDALTQRYIVMYEQALAAPPRPARPWLTRWFGRRS
jgi:phosphatidylinositol alpha-mannosyltransferase